jgi:hypothetical protein
MTTLKTLAAAALLSALAATPVFAQAAIGEPGAFAFYHPDRDVLNGGAPLSAGVASGAAASQAYAAIPLSPRYAPHRRIHRSGH